MLIEGLTASGLEHHRIPRNAELFDDPTYCGYCNAGCQQGCKRSVLKNYLQDAADSGARFLVDCFVEKITTEDGRATGVKARVGETEVTVEAPTVVVACGGSSPRPCCCAPRSAARRSARTSASTRAT